MVRLVRNPIEKFGRLGVILKTLVSVLGFLWRLLLFDPAVAACKVPANGTDVGVPVITLVQFWMIWVIAHPSYSIVTTFVLSKRQLIHEINSELNTYAVPKPLVFFLGRTVSRHD